MLNTTYPHQTSGLGKFFSVKLLYLLMAIAGSIIPWNLLLKYFLKNGWNINLFLQNTLTNNLCCAFAADLVISAVVFLCFSFVELKRLGLSRRWLAVYIVATFGIGLSCSLPLFFYFREQVWQKKYLVN